MPFIPFERGWVNRHFKISILEELLMTAGTNFEILEMVEYVSVGFGNLIFQTKSYVYFYHLSCMIKKNLAPIFKYQKQDFRHDRNDRYRYG